MSWLLRFVYLLSSKMLRPSSSATFFKRLRAKSVRFVPWMMCFSSTTMAGMRVRPYWSARAKSCVMAAVEGFWLEAD